MEFQENIVGFWRCLLDKSLFIYSYDWFDYIKCEGCQIPFEICNWIVGECLETIVLLLYSMYDNV